jgi:hypothetical protein
MNKLISTFVTLSGQTQHLLPYVLGTKEMISFAH